MEKAASPQPHEPAPPQGSPGEVLLAFLKLGLSAFGGPIAHIGYFRREFVERRKWLSETAYADLVALAQFLPGPASSQVGFALGLQRAGALGAAAAWTGFTLPSAILMTAFALTAAAFKGPVAAGAIHGLKLVAAAVVAQAVLGMARTLAPDARRAGIAIAALALASLGPPRLAQLAAIGLGAAAGLALCRGAEGVAPASSRWRVSGRAGLTALALYLGLLIGLPAAAAVTGSAILTRVEAFYRSGALVFGGGHVVLPLLKAAVVDPGWVSSQMFLAGYGAAQAMPGPLFTFAAFLGAAMNGPASGIAGAAMALAAIFVPGLLALVAALPFWGALRTRPLARAAMRGANAAVVGVLAGALYDPVWTSAVLGRLDLVLAAAGFALLMFRVPPIAVVAFEIIAGGARGLWA
ncbi:MAG TPA: chromate efflux transporter [Caulobacteraceae bacterium]|nr:chromate efflux transporter [Caulobacteraceae bacterium]